MEYESSYHFSALLLQLAQRGIRKNVQKMEQLPKEESIHQSDSHNKCTVYRSAICVDCIVLIVCDFLIDVKQRQELFIPDFFIRKKMQIIYDVYF